MRNLLIHVGFRYTSTLDRSLTDFCSSSVPPICQAPPLAGCIPTQGYLSGQAPRANCLDIAHAGLGIPAPYCG